MIRKAQDKDIPRIVEMGSRSIAEGPYKDQLSDNPEVTAGLAEKLIRSDSSRVLVYEREGRLEGLFAFILFPHYFSGELTAGEMMWYVEPEQRAMRGFGASPAFELLEAGEKIAREAGAKRMQLTAPTETVGLLYQRRGYAKVETTHQKKL